ncbi:MAG: hypothetical protein ACLQVI_15075 [Polyangiaceae bacterium]
MNELVSRPSVLGAVHTPKPWGWELWLTSTRPEGPATVAPPGSTLADLVAAHPEVLGAWARLLFGDQMPIFAKLIHTDFPARVHLGFRRPVERGELLAWLDREQELMRRLFGALRISSAPAFATYQARYSSWATAQALAAWRRDDDAATAATLRDFVDPAFDLVPWVRAVRDNRAVVVDALGEIDLRQERGNLLLSSAGIIHAIFGLSHQTHPLDPTRAPLQTLFTSLSERAAAGATDDELARAIDAVGLPSKRGAGRAPPKNEAWFPTTVDGAEVLAEPQQTSDTTYSLADFYTPLTWSGDRPRFRKGSPTSGLSHEELSGYVADVDLSATPLDSIRRSPKQVPGASRKGAELFRLVDEPAAWPFFTAYQLELSGELSLRPPPGVFQQLVVTRGRVQLGDAAGVVGELSPHAPGFVPASLDGAYTLTAREPSTILIFAVPGARGGAPRL